MTFLEKEKYTDQKRWLFNRAFLDSSSSWWPPHKKTRSTSLYFVVLFVAWSRVLFETSLTWFDLFCLTIHLCLLVNEICGFFFMSRLWFKSTLDFSYCVRLRLRMWMFVITTVRSKSRVGPTWEAQIQPINPPPSSLLPPAHALAFPHQQNACSLSISFVLIWFECFWLPWLPPAQVPPATAKPWLTLDVVWIGVHEQTRVYRFLLKHFKRVGNFDGNEQAH